MNGRIDKHGCLVVDGKMQICPLVRGSDACGDWCPAFREPEKETKEHEVHVDPDPELPAEMGYYRKMRILTGRTTLQLCTMVGTLVFDEFEDER